MVAKDLYALSALTRNNAGALKALMDADGLALIATTAAAESRPGGSACKVRVKSIAFMADLLASTETDRRQGSYDVQSVDAAHVEDTEVIDALGRPEWCNLVIGSLPLCDSPVWQEKVLHGMAQLKAKSMVSYVCVCVCLCVCVSECVRVCLCPLSHLFFHSCPYSACALGGVGLRGTEDQRNVFPLERTSSIIVI